MPRKRPTWSLQDAKNRFSHVVEAAQRSPQVVTKHGRPAVVIIAAGEFARLESLERRDAPRFIDHLLAMPTDDVAFERLPARLRQFE
jgi:prevent-host-death family protein